MERLTGHVFYADGLKTNKRLLLSGKITVEKLDSMLLEGKITQEEYDYITGA